MITVEPGYDAFNYFVKIPITSVNLDMFAQDISLYTCTLLNSYSAVNYYAYKTVELDSYPPR